MSKFQPAYDRAKQDVKRNKIPAIRDQISELETRLRQTTDLDMKKSIQAEIKSLQIKMKSIRKNDPVKEENLEEAKKGLSATKDKWISKIGGNKNEVSKYVEQRVKELEERYGDDYAAIVGTLKKILSQKYDVNLDEEAQGAITTGSVGQSTMTTSDGGTEPAIYGSSHVHAKHMGTFSRRGGYTPPVHDDGRKKSKKKKKKKKTQKEFVEFYFEEQS